MSATIDNLLLADKLRTDDPEQFYILVRMHLSFVLDLNTEDCDTNLEKKFRPLKWNLPFSKKQKGYTKSCAEGSQLTADSIAQMNKLIEFLSQEENICQEGIFRRSGKVTRQQELKSLLSQGAQINLNDGQYSVHDCASVLKNVLSELPESILTDAHYPAYCQIAEFCNVKNPASEERLLRSLQLLILLLPTENRNFLQEIIALLHLAASYEDKNRMSADNLATLFTPHLLCPRKLSPEALHTNSQIMSRVVAFMIQKGAELFEIPHTLATDVRAYWNKKEKRKMSPLKQMNESVCDGTAANTVFSFVDRERTAQENGANPTETALAQLYAHIQSLPESSKKKKLIKQFNKENGHGTPLRGACPKKRTRSRSLGDSIKKHLPVFNKTKRPLQPDVGRPDSNSPGPPAVFPGKKLFNIGLDDSKTNQKENIPSLKPPLLTNSKPIALRSKKKPNEENRTVEAIASLRQSFKNSSHSKLCEDLDNGSLEMDDDSYSSGELNPDNESTGDQKVKIPAKRKSSSPVDSPSPSKTPRLSSNSSFASLIPSTSCTGSDKLRDWPETMMTPRSRKPVISLSGTDLCHLASVDSWGAQCSADETINTKPERTSDFGKKLILEDSNEAMSDSLSSTFRDYLFNRSVLRASPVDSSFSSRTDDFLSLSEKNSSMGNEDFKSLPESILNEAGLSESLLYCLDGNEPGSNDTSRSGVIDEPKMDDCSCSFSECHDHVNQHIYETAL